MNSLPKNIQTLKELQVLEKGSGTGRYIRHITVLREPKTVELLTIALLQHAGQEGLTWESITQHPVFFPFRIENVSQADMAASEKIQLNKMGDRILIVAKM